MNLSGGNLYLLFRGTSTRLDVATETFGRAISHFSEKKFCLDWAKKREEKIFVEISHILRPKTTPAWGGRRGGGTNPLGVKLNANVEGEKSDHPKFAQKKERRKKK